MQNKNRKTQGFTLVELLIVIAIIGILAAVLIPNLLGSRAQAFDTGAMNCAKALQTAQTNYNGKQFTYADSIDDLNEDLLAPCLTGAAAGQIQIGDAAPSAVTDDATNSGEMTSATATTFSAFVWDKRGSTVYAVNETDVRAQ